MVLDVSLGILTPDDWVVAFRFEKLCNMPGPCFDRVEPFLAEHAYYMSLNGNDGGGGKVVSENAECCGGLHTGGEGVYNQWIHCDLIVIF